MDTTKIENEIHSRLCMLWDDGLLTRQNAEHEVNAVLSAHNVPLDANISVDIFSKGGRMIDVNIEEKIDE